MKIYLKHISLNFYNIIHSHITVSNSIMKCFILFSFYFSWFIIKENNTQVYIYANYLIHCYIFSNIDFIFHLKNIQDIQDIYFASLNIIIYADTIRRHFWNIFFMLCHHINIILLMQSHKWNFVFLYKK